MFVIYLVPFSASLSKELKSLPDKKQFVSSAKSFITILLRDLCISFIITETKLVPKRIIGAARIRIILTFLIERY